MAKGRFDVALPTDVDFLGGSGFETSERVPSDHKRDAEGLYATAQYSNMVANVRLRNSRQADTS